MMKRTTLAFSTLLCLPALTSGQHFMSEQREETLIANEATDFTAAAAPLTQFDMNQQAGDRLAAADDELNRVYREIRRRYSDRPIFLEKLKLAQRAWIAFRDAELDALYPPTEYGDQRASYGSMFPMCYGNAKERLTRERTQQLRRWLDGIKEGNVCGGSIKLDSALHQGDAD